MKNRRFYLLCSFLSNVLIFVMAFYAVGMSFREHARGVYQESGWATFRYFTTDSNLLCGLASLLTAGFSLPMLLGKTERVPRSILLLKYFGTCAVSLTFTVVILFLGPVFGYGSMYGDASFYMHGVIPILAMVSWIVFDRGYRPKLWAVPAAMVFVAVYGIVYYFQVVIRGVSHGGWRDFYAFTHGGKWWLSILLIGIGAAILCILMLFLHNRCDREKPGE